jgi:hypothetical protein
MIQADFEERGARLKNNHPKSGESIGRKRSV